MKLTITTLILLIFTSFTTINLNDKDTIPIHISDKEYSYVIHVIQKEIHTIYSDRLYYWYKSQQIHKSRGEFGGQLLDGNFVKYYKTNQLAEKGDFKKGLKKGRWIKWYKNGNKEEELKWKNGKKCGVYHQYDSLGNLVLSGKYKQNNKSGVWIDYLKSDTLYYKKGKLLKDKPSSITKRITEFVKKKCAKKDKEKQKRQKTKKKKSGAKKDK
jgi:antitoxin component YwqK of YwqJK toxin-antitoxin module